MNERIKELRAKSMVPVQKDGYTSWVFDEEQFAELIVRECLEIVEDGVLNSDGEGVWFEGYQRGANECHRKIKQHFGVEK